MLRTVVLLAVVTFALKAVSASPVFILMVRTENPVNHTGDAGSSWFTPP